MGDEKPNFEAMYINAAKHISNLEKEKEQLKEELKTYEAVETKLEDRIDGLEQIITILTKIYL